MSGAPGSRRAKRRGDGPARLADGKRVLSREECDEIFRRVSAFARGGGDTKIALSSWWQGELRWARNRV
ncbi:MAG TPA: hypothetical protein VFT57_00550, partial [Gemmatimonadaceae bacterium]|nr:hypothetical protein [Gemmatimonadaceae bacterium]